jgi:hypothetical protein
LALRFALNARELSSHALGWRAVDCRRAARQGFALPRRISSPPRKSRFALLRSGFAVVHLAGRFFICKDS